MERIFREVFGDDVAPAEADAFSFVSRSELDRVGRELRLQPGQTFVDLACGAGGPGLWIARATGLNVCGIDISATGIEQATGRAAAAGMSERARYQVGEFGATGLPTKAFDGAISIDALWLAGDKRAAFAETARILRPGARLVGTTWESSRQIPDFPPQVDDYRPLLLETARRRAK
jgi:ubiquinone/menaquinone biosynthesis C-methylase UbiE